MSDLEFDKNNLDSEENLQSEQLWLRELLLRDSERFQLPESLKSQNLMHRLNELEPEAPKNAENITVLDSGKKTIKKPIVLKYLSYAACLTIIGFGWYNAQQSASKSATPSAEAPQLSASGLSASESVMMTVENEINISIEQPVAENYSAVYDALTSAQANQSVRYGYGRGMAPEWSVNEEESIQNDSAGSVGIQVAPVAPQSGIVQKSSVYSTNNQVSGVDEADIVKTDGVYIYHYRFNNQTGGAQIAISTANGLKVLSAIELPEYANSEMYVSGNRLIVVQSVPEKTVEKIVQPLEKPLSDFLDANEDTVNKLNAVPGLIVPDYYKGNYDGTIAMTEAVTYDITDHKKPKELSRFRQDGNYVSSRLANNTLYLVTNKSVHNDVSAINGSVYHYIPVVGEQQTLRVLPAEDIIIPPYLENLNYAVVTAINLLNQTADTKAVLGMADQIMMSKNNLFLTATVNSDGTRRWYEQATGITRFAITEGGLQYQASGKVDGYIDNQFSLDEYNGNLRIATTSYNDKNQTVNNVFVLDRMLKQIGAVENLAEGERIYSVRYMDDTAYVVTFRQTDPLFVIDLSNPAKPVVKGELKIPGFSEYLHPIDKDTLVGLGVNTVVNKFGSVAEDGLKLSLFDVSDPTAPKEKATYLLGNMGSTSEALSNHKAFMYYPEQKLIGFPATVYTTQGGEANNPWAGQRNVSFSGYLVIKVNDNGFDVVGTIPNDSNKSVSGFMRTDTSNAIERGIFIGQTLYTTAQARIMAFSLDDFKQIGELEY